MKMTITRGGYPYSKGDRPNTVHADSYSAPDARHSKVSTDQCRDFSFLKCLCYIEIMEFDPDQHETFVSKRLEQLRISIARVALFDEMIDYHLDGQCTFEQAVAQFLHDADRDGIGYPPTPSGAAATQPSS